MTDAKSALAAHRARRAGQGFVRVEVTVRKEDAPFVRGVAAALADPVRQVAARRVLHQGLLGTAAPDLKALLASAPLEGVDLDRDPDLGRDMDL